MAEAVVGHAAVNGDAQAGTSAKETVLLGAVKMASDRSAPDLAGVDVEGGGELDVAHVVGPRRGRMRPGMNPSSGAFR